MCSFVEDGKHSSNVGIGLKSGLYGSFVGRERDVREDVRGGCCDVIMWILQGRYLRVDGLAGLDTLHGEARDSWRAGVKVVCRRGTG